jgi:CRP-like cAMP-binding protein
MDSVSKQEGLIDQYLGEGNKDAAVKLLYELIVENAKQKNFLKAETLRDKLLDVAPMALKEISDSGDIIDDEKSKSIDQNHRNTWAELYGNFTPEEVNALYFSMKERVFNEGDIISSVGDADTNMYFLDKGQIDMVFIKDDVKTLKILEPGDIAGEDTFFYHTAVRTVTLIAKTKVKTHALDRKNIALLNEKYPAIEQKLADYCNKTGRVSEILLKKGMNRRRNLRKKLNGKVGVQLLNSSGAPAGKPFIGNLYDISISGLSFTFRLSNNEVAHKLLGAKIKTQLVIPDAGSSKRIEQIGKIVGIGYHVLSDHSIHVRFDQPDEEIKKLMGL